MKQLSMIKRVVISTLAILAIPPAISRVAISYSKPKISLSYIDYNTLYDAILDVQTPNKYSEKAVSKSISYDELLFGTKNMNDGNYVLLVGSNKFDSCCSFFGEYDLKERTIED